MAKNLYFHTKITGIFIYLLGVYLLAILFMTLFRVFLLGACFENIDSQLNTYVYQQIFTKGFRFDNSIVGYIMIIPVITLPLLGIFNRLNDKIIKASSIYFSIMYTLLFAFSSANIPYFKYFFRHINPSILNWIEFGDDATSMILEEKSYWLYFFLFILISIIFSYLVFKLGKLVLEKFTLKHQKEYRKYSITCLLFAILFCIFSIRGNVRQRETLQIGYAFFCGNTILNQLPINPVFFFFKSNYSASKSLIDLDIAASVAKKDINYDIEKQNYNAPLNIESSNNSNPPNIVLVLVESFSSNYLDINKKDGSLMPFMHDLINKSYYFDNFYSQGIHTNQGIVASLFSFPTILDYHMFKSYTINEISKKSISSTGAESNKKNLIPIYQGLPSNLKRYGYENLFFITHVPTFDNIQNFLIENKIDKVYNQNDYPQSEIVYKWGINDHSLFKHALTECNQLYKKNTPFFSSILTISNHPPYYYSDEFSTVSQNEDEKSVAYTDWCIKYFMEESSKKDWYENTIFLFIGDHGKTLGASNMDNLLSLNHVPLIIYSPMFENMPQKISNVSGQIDIYPTVMGLLDIPCQYKSFGKNILKEKRDKIYFSSDDKLTCLDDNYIYTYNLSSDTETLYEYTNPDRNIIRSNRSIADSLKTYCFSMIETAKHIYKNELKE